MLLTQNENIFLIIVDKEYIEKQYGDTGLDIKKICFKMLWMYINEYIDKKDNIVADKIISPQNCCINSKELLFY